MIACIESVSLLGDVISVRNDLWQAEHFSGG